MLPYGRLLTLALFWLVLQHVCSPNFSARSKGCVVGLVVATSVVPWLWTSVSFAATIFQFGLAIFLIIQRMVRVPEWSEQNILSAPSDKTSGSENRSNRIGI